jgi:hypothetical protein
MVSAMLRVAFFLRFQRFFRRLALVLSVALLQVTSFLACGSRTALPFDEVGIGAPEADGGTSPGTDGRVEPLLDALPPLDVTERPDVDRTDCADSGATLIYLVTSEMELVSFDPSISAFRRIGILSCPAPRGAAPFSMAVDRKGTAYVLYESETGGSGQLGAGLYKVSTATAACSKTSYQPPAGSPFDLFGMGFATDELGPSETLFVASAQDRVSSLATIDVNTFTLRTVGDFVPTLAGTELTGSGAGELFAFYSDRRTNSPDSYVMQVDKKTAKIVSQDLLRGVRQGEGWAFAFWGGDFWLFTAPGGNISRVQRFRPSDKSLIDVAEFPSRIVGAGVSTCAPQ